MRAQDEDSQRTGTDSKERDRNALIGQRLQLGSKGGWIEIQHPVTR